MGDDGKTQKNNGFYVCLCFFSKESSFLLISMDYLLSVTDKGTEAQRGQETYSRSYS